MHATTATEIKINITEHMIDPELTRTAKMRSQYNLKPGLQKFGECGAKATVSKLTQLHILDMWAVMDSSTLTKEGRSKALSSLLFLKKKCCGKIKGRACINGAPQRAYIPKEDRALTTVSTKSMFSTSTVAASKKRHVRC
jgi:hypothetical protein